MSDQPADDPPGKPGVRRSRLTIVADGRRAGKTYEELAHELGVTIKYVQKLIHLAKKAGLDTTPPARQKAAPADDPHVAFDVTDNPGTKKYKAYNNKLAALLQQVAARQAGPRPFPPDDRPGAQMRYVLNQMPDCDLTPVEKVYRKSMDRNLHEYRREMERREAEESLAAAGRPAAAAAETVEPDERTPMLKKMCLDLLRELAAGRK